MADEPAVEDLPISVPTNLDEVDALFARKRKLKPKIDEATAQLQAIRANALSLQKTVVSPLLKVDQAIDDAIEQYLTENRSSLRRKHGKTITLSNGQVKWFVRKAVELPKDQSPMLAALEGRKGGDRYITYTPTANEGAIANAPRSIKRFLAAFGVVVARFEHLNINVEGFKDPIKLYRRRYFGPLRQK